MQPKISVILPVYNVAPYLRKCMDSLLAQTLHDIEIIAVDDCSPDDSIDILLEYAAIDERIIIVRNEKNLKLAGARNAGLAVATGEYVSIIDSDDYIDLDFLEKLYSLAKHEDADIAKGVRRDLPANQIINNNTMIKRNKWNFRFTLWTAIFRRSLLELHDIKFVVDTIVFQMRAVYYANKISTRDDTFYNYCRREDSNDSPSFSLEKWQSLNIRGGDLVLDFINSVEIKKSDYLLLVKKLILPLYFYGYNKMEDVSKAKAAEILEYVLAESWRKVKYKPSLSLEYRKRKRELFNSGRDCIAIATFSNDVTTNIGDAIQENAIYDAIKTVLPDVKVTKIPRKDWMYSKFRSLSVMQGWFGNKTSIPKGRKLWIATHFAGELRESYEITPPRVKGFGAKDISTAKIVPGAYISRCYTLTLPKRDASPEDGRVFLTNIPTEWEKFIPDELIKDCVRVTHHYEGSDMATAARELIAQFRDEARLVISCKVHCLSPCVAMGIPVVALLEGNEGMARMSFLSGIIPFYTEQELRDGRVDWNPSAPAIETLKSLMLANLKLSILAAQGYHVDNSELNNIRHKIEEYHSTPHLHEELYKMPSVSAPLLTRSISIIIGTLKRCKLYRPVYWLIMKTGLWGIVKRFYKPMA